MVKERPEDPHLHSLVESFFREHLQRVRGASHHTVAAYRDTLRLLFAFLAQTYECSVVDLNTAHLQLDKVLQFLTHLEADRQNSVATRNHRLAAIRTFFRHLIRQDPTRASQYYRVVCLPSKKSRQSIATYLEPEEVQCILRKPDVRTRAGSRDHTLLLFMYNTGARVSEALGVRECDLTIDNPPHVRIHGKGDKDRICPLWRETAAAIRRMLSRHPVAPTGYIFRNAQGHRLSRDGVAYILQKYVSQAATERPRLADNNITPHALRHSCAVALLQAGADLSVIRDYLGHSTIRTTSRYVKTNLKMKRDVLEAFWQRAGVAAPAVTAWHPEPDLLAFLDSL